MNDHPIIAILGTGAVGGYYGGMLARRGNDVHFLARSDFDAIQSKGLEIRSRSDSFTLSPARVAVYRSSSDMPRADLVIVTIKATSNDQLESLIRPLLHEQTAILTLQNGFGNEDALAELFGASRVIGGMAFVCLNRIAPGVVHHIGHGLIRLGEFVPPGRSERAIQIERMFIEAGVPCEAIDDLHAGRWRKLVWNIPFNGLGAVMDLSTDRLIDTDAGRLLVSDLMREVIAIAHAEGVASIPDTYIEQQLNDTREMGAYMTSMQIDRRENRPMEVEAILGEPLRRAKKAGVATPILEQLYRFARAIRH